MNTATTATTDTSTAIAAIAPLLQVEHLQRSYQLPRRQLWRAPETVAALQDISLQIHAGRSLGVVGEYIAKIYNEAKARPRFIIDKYIKKDV